MTQRALFASVETAAVGSSEEREQHGDTSMWTRLMMLAGCVAVDARFALGFLLYALAVARSA